MDCASSFFISSKKGLGRLQGFPLLRFFMAFFLSSAASFYGVSIKDAPEDLGQRL